MVLRRGLFCPQETLAVSGNIVGWHRCGVLESKEAVGQTASYTQKSIWPKMSVVPGCKILLLTKGQSGYWIRSTVKSMALGSDTPGLRGPT